MKKYLVFLFACAFALCACEKKSVEQAYKSGIYLGDYLHKGVAVNYYTVTRNGVKKEETIMSSFINKNLSISNDKEENKLVVYSERYGLTYAEIKEGELIIEGKQGTFIDDGSYIQKGSTIHYEYRHSGAKFKNDSTLTWKTGIYITGVNASNTATLEIVSDVENIAVKKLTVSNN